jgi:hypothetical protein
MAMIDRTMAGAAMLLLLPQASLSAQLTPGYLQGAWCYSHYDVGGSREDQNITYLFQADGSLLYQGAPGGALTQRGRYRIEGDTVRIEPSLMLFALTVASTTNDSFVLQGMGEHHFVRGRCRVRQEP